jgi:hypothetical protein
LVERNGFGRIVREVVEVVQIRRRQLVRLKKKREASQLVERGLMSREWLETSERGKREPEVLRLERVEGYEEEKKVLSCEVTG